MAWKRMAVLIALAAAALASGDVVHFKDGSKLEGTVRHGDDGRWNVTANGKTTSFSNDQIDSIEVISSTPATASVRLASLRRATDNVDDPNVAVTQYQRFIDQDRDPAVTADAKKDLLIWQDRVARGMTRVGGKWVTPEDRSRLLQQANATADRARQLLKQGRVLEAAPLLNDALAVDPQNVTALYLSGLMAYDQDKLPAARKAFDAVNAGVPNHAPTLTNLAIVQFRQKQYVAAMISFDSAMQAAPENKEVLDDVATALQQWPANVRKSDVVLKVEKRFLEQDTQLAKKLAAVGLHRVGATWVDTQDINIARQREQAALARLDQLAADFDQTTDRVKAIDQSANDTQDQMHRIEAQSVYVDPRTGGLVQIPFPPTYATLTADLARMKRDRATAVTQLDTIAREGAVIQNARMQQHGIGVLRLIGPEGTPLKLPAPAAAPPAPAATQPIR
jgi:tetratricopeptide (TPR) repeat protein